MSGVREGLVASAARLFEGWERTDELGGWAEGLWGELEKAGLTLTSVPEGSGGTGGSLSEAVAKVRTGEAAGKAAAIAHQVHGAIGFTERHPLHESTRRLWAWRDEYGAESEWAERLGSIVGGCGPENLWPILTAPPPALG